MKIASLFCGAGGLDLGFHHAGFEVVWANDNNDDACKTYAYNSPDITLVRKNITKVDPYSIPNVDGIIGGPPCQSWSIAGANRGMDDKHGQMFNAYINIIAAKRPQFFVAENVAGILGGKHQVAFDNIIRTFRNLGYDVSYHLLNAADYGVPQDRERVIIVGYLNQLKMTFNPPIHVYPKPTLYDAIFSVTDALNNHEYLDAPFSSRFLSRNRVRKWDEQSFTICASGKHVPLHPQAPKMTNNYIKNCALLEGFPGVFKRLSIRECARIQTFPDTHLFLYKNILSGYRLVGNAVPVKFAFHIARQIRDDLL